MGSKGAVSFTPRPLKEGVVDFRLQKFMNAAPPFRGRGVIDYLCTYGRIVKTI